MPSKRVPLSGKASSYPEWQLQFHERVIADAEARTSWEFLTDRRCEETVLHTCLIRICLDAEDELSADSYEVALRTLARQDASRIKRDKNLLDSIKDNYSDELFDALNKASALLDQAAKDADRQATKPQWRDPRRGYFLSFLVSYVRLVTGQKHFAHLAALVRCGCMPDDPEGGYSADAVRKAFVRFSRRSPSTLKSIEKAVAKLCRTGVGNRPLTGHDFSD